MENSIDQLYLELLKKALSFLLWTEPPMKLENTWEIRRSKVKRKIASFLSNILKRFRLQIVREHSLHENTRAEGKIWPRYADTMIGIKRLNNIQSCIENVLNNGIEGDLIETGVWRGGACIFMRGVLNVYGVKNKRVFVADSFKGLPKGEAEKYPHDKESDLYSHSILSVSR